MASGFISYIRNSIDELRAVVWPNRQTVVRHTAIILVSVAIATLIISVIDFGLSLLVNTFLLK